MDFFVQVVTVLSVLGSLIAYIYQRQNKRFQSIQVKLDQLVDQKSCIQRRKNCPCCAQVRTIQSFVKK